MRFILWLTLIISGHYNYKTAKERIPLILNQFFVFNNNKYISRKFLALFLYSFVFLQL